MPAPGANAYLRTKVLTANPAELRLMLLDGAIRFAEQAREGLERRDYETVFTGATRCQNILLELISGLRPEHDKDLCEKLSGLYTFMYLHMVKAASDRKLEMVDDVLKLLRFERETWQMLVEQIAGDADASAVEDSTTESSTRANPHGHRSGAAGLPGTTISVRG